MLYPGHMIAMTGSVFMTVAIAMERYVAVHYPLDYNQVRRRRPQEGNRTINCMFVTHASLSQIIHATPL